MNLKLQPQHRCRLKKKELKKYLVNNRDLRIINLCFVNLFKKLHKVYERNCYFFSFI